MMLSSVAVALKAWNAQPSNRDRVVDLDRAVANWIAADGLEGSVSWVRDRLAEEQRSQIVGAA